jgi:hypothetical protein
VPIDPPSLSEEVVNTAPRVNVGATKLEACAAETERADSTTARDVKRSELRARFDALSDRLMAVEDGLDTLIRRSAHRDKLDRRSELRSVEMIDNVAVAGERQAAVLEGLFSTVTRLEHSMARLEQSLSKVERAVSERRRDSHYPAVSHMPRTSPSAFPESHAAPRSTRHSEVEEIDHHEGSGINGNLSEVSLATVMAMLEIERHTGRLKVATEDGTLASFELSEGSVISSRLAENDVDPLHTLRAALCWKSGRFWFRPQPAEAASFPPRSIGSLLLEATRQNDESFADVG